MDSPASFEIVPFDPARQDAVRSLAAEILCEELAVQPNLDGEEDLVDIAATYAAPDGRFVVGLVGGHLVATGGIRRISAEDCQLARLYVQSDHRRQGLASRIVAGLVRFVQKRGYRRILLEIRPEMETDRAVYRRYGFADLPESERSPGGHGYMAIQL